MLIAAPFPFPFQFTLPFSFLCLCTANTHRVLHFCVFMQLFCTYWHPQCFTVTVKRAQTLGLTLHCPSSFRTLWYCNLNKGAGRSPHLTIKSHPEVGPEHPAARVYHLHDLVVGSVQSVVQSAQFLKTKQKKNRTDIHHISSVSWLFVCDGQAQESQQCNITGFKENST